MLRCRNQKPDEVNATKPCVIESRLTEDRKIDINNCDQYRDGATAILVLVLCFGLVLFYSYNGILSSRLSNMDVFVSNECTLVRTIMLQPNNTIYKWFSYANSGVIHTQQQPRCHVW